MNDEKKLILVGSGAVGRFTLDICRALLRPVSGFLDDVNDAGVRINGVPVVGKTTLLADPAFLEAHAVVLSIGDQATRYQWYEGLKSRNVEMPSIIHPSTEISSFAKLGEGCIVNAYSQVHANTAIGPLCIIEDHSSVGIDNEIDSNVVLATSVTTNRNVSIGAHSFLGSGCTVIPDRTIGRHAFVGAAACVTQDVAATTVVAGVPAKPLKKRI